MAFYKLLQLSDSRVVPVALNTEPRRRIGSDIEDVSAASHWLSLIPPHQLRPTHRLLGRVPDGSLLPADFR